MKKRPRHREVILRVAENWEINGRRYPYVYLVRGGSRSETSLLAHKDNHPSSVYILEDSILDFWTAFVPLWCSPYDGSRFFNRLKVDYRIVDYKLSTLRERIVA